MYNYIKIFFFIFIFRCFLDCIPFPAILDVFSGISSLHPVVYVSHALILNFMCRGSSNAAAMQLV